MFYVKFYPTISSKPALLLNYSTILSEGQVCIISKMLNTLQAITHDSLMTDKIRLNLS